MIIVASGAVILVPHKSLRVMDSVCKLSRILYAVTMDLFGNGSAVGIN
jgi:hypothetical protein